MSSWRDQILKDFTPKIPLNNAKHTDWFHFARGWAELILLANDQAEAIPEQMAERTKHLQAQVDAGFAAWLLSGTPGLSTCRQFLRSCCITFRGFLPVRWEKTVTQRSH